MGAAMAGGGGWKDAMRGLCGTESDAEAAYMLWIMGCSARLCRGEEVVRWMCAGYMLYTKCPMGYERRNLRRYGTWMDIGGG